jgi:hypothetical protein
MVGWGVDEKPSSFIMRAFCTVVSLSHLRPAYALAASLKSSLNTEQLHVLVIDAHVENLPVSPSGVILHSIDSVRDRLPPLMVFYFDAFELCNALKPFLVSLLFDLGAETVIYLDSDIYAVSSFEPVWSGLELHPVLLTPHLLQPPPLDLVYTNEVGVVDQGVYNGGFTAWRRGPESERALTWMCERFVRYGFNDRPNGMFVDQKLLPLVADYYSDDIWIWREPTVNIAFWNVHERQVEIRNGQYFIRDQPVIFFHLSGFRSECPNVPCTYLPPTANENIISTAPWLSEVMTNYGALVDSISNPQLSAEYPFSKRDGFVLIPGLRRIIFKRGKLSRRDPDVLRVLLIYRLKVIKRRIIALWKVIACKN